MCVDSYGIRWVQTLLATLRTPNCLPGFSNMVVQAQGTGVDILGFHYHLPSGKLTYSSYGKSLFLMGKSTINRDFQ